MSFWPWWGRGRGNAGAGRCCIATFCRLLSAAKRRPFAAQDKQDRRTPKIGTSRNGCPTSAAALCAGAGAADTVAVTASSIVTPAAGVSLGDIVVGPAAAVVVANLHAFAIVAGQCVGERRGNPRQNPGPAGTHGEKLLAKPILALEQFLAGGHHERGIQRAEIADAQGAARS